MRPHGPSRKRHSSSGTGCLKQRPDHPELLDHLARLSVATPSGSTRPLEAARRLSQPGWEARGLFLLAADPGLHRRSRRCRRGLRAGARARAGRPRRPARRRPTTASSWRGTCSGWAAPPRPRPLKAIRPASDDSTSATDGSRGRMAAEPGLSPAGPHGRALPTPWRGSGSYRRRAPPDARARPLCGLGRLRAVPSPRESEPTQRTRHNAILPPRAGLLGLPLPDRPLADPDDPKVTHTIDREGRRRSRSRARSTTASTRMVVEYAFGTPERYLTMIGRDEEKTYRALRVSYYHTRPKVGLGTDRGRRRPFRLARRRPRPADRRARRRRPLPVLPRHPVPRLPRPAAGRRARPRGRRPRHRLRALPRARRRTTSRRSRTHDLRGPRDRQRRPALRPRRSTPSAPSATSSA